MAHRTATTARVSAGIALVLLAAFGSFVQCSFHPNNPQPRGGYLPFEAAGAEITPKGEVSAPYSISLWPQPQQLQAGEGTTALDVNFQFKYVGAMNVSSLVADILEDNFNRYYSILFAAVQPSSMSQREEATKSLSLTVLQLLVNVTSTDDSFGLGTNESYSLSVGEGDSQGHLSCMTVYGCIRGLETFSQLVIHPTDAVSMPFLTGIPFIINDFPRFPHRGLLMDSSRHYLPLASIQRIVDALSYDKANVLHWHMTDAQSFPFASQRVPEMVEGAWGPLAVYTVDDVGAIVQYARYRGVAVVLELDSPSHVQSWGVGRPDIIVNATSNPYWSVLNPAVNATYEVYASLIQELRTVLIDDRFHLGNDEVQFQVYNTSQVNAWMAASGIAAGDYAGVVRHHMQAAQSIVEDAGFEHLLWWQEAFDHYGTGNNTPTPPPAFLTNNSVAYLWYCPCWHWYNMLNVTTMGFRGVKTDDWYLDNLDSTWSMMYTKDPLNDAVSCDYSPGWANCTCPTGGCFFNITEVALVERVLGGEGCAWGEYMDGTMIEGRVWPRMSAIAERLWARQDVTDPNAALPRLVDHRCRMILRGMGVEPLQPDYCDGSRR